MKNLYAPIGVVINGDTRPGWDEDASFCGNGMGCRSADFMTDMVLNKVHFFRGYNVHVTLYIDIHTPLSPEVYQRIMELLNEGVIDNVCFDAHVEFFRGEYVRQAQCTMYLNALTINRGRYIAHFDADTVAFRTDESDIIDRWIDWVDSGKYKYVSYPVVTSPNPCEPDGFDYYWPSTRFFFCKREEIQFDAIAQCFDDRQWVQLHGDRPFRYPNCMEQILGFLAGPESIYYPMKEFEQYMIFCWHTYYKGIAKKLDSMSYSDVYKYVMEDCGGIAGACESHANPCVLEK